MTSSKLQIAFAVFCTFTVSLSVFSTLLLVGVVTGYVFIGTKEKVKEHAYLKNGKEQLTMLYNSKTGELTPQ